MHTLPGESYPEIKVILFDYGGVLAEEGFREGLMAIGSSHGLSPDDFFETARTAVYDSGYVVGTAGESDYWALVRVQTGISTPDQALREEILNRFVLRPWMLEIAQHLRNQGCSVGILSDQTDWLDELDRRDHFFEKFDYIFNSYHMGIGKRDPRVFSLVVEQLEVPASNVLFIDDNEGNVERARSQGLTAIFYQDRDSFLGELQSLGLITAADSGLHTNARSDKE